MLMIRVNLSTACAQVTEISTHRCYWKSISPYGIFSPSKLKVKTTGSTQSSDYYETKTKVA